MIPIDLFLDAGFESPHWPHDVGLKWFSGELRAKTGLITYIYDKDGIGEKFKLSW